MNQAAETILNAIETDKLLTLNLLIQVINLDNIELNVYHQALTLIKNVFSHTENVSFEQLQQFWSEISEEMQIQIINSAVRGLMMENQVTVNLSAKILQILFSFDKVNGLPIIEKMIAILTSTEYSENTKHGAIITILEILQNCQLESCPRKLWITSFSIPFRTICQSLVTILSSPTNFEVSLVIDVFNTLSLLIKCLRQELKIPATQKVILDLVVGVLEICISENLYKSIIEFLMSYTETFYAQPDVLIDEVFSIIYKGIISENPIFSIQSIDFLIGLYNKEHKMKGNEDLEKVFSRVKSEITHKHQLTCELESPIPKEINRNFVLCYTKMFIPILYQIIFRPVESTETPALHAAMLLKMFFDVEPNDQIDYINNFFETPLDSDDQSRMFTLTLIVRIMSGKYNKSTVEIIQPHTEFLINCVHSENSSLTESALVAMFNLTKNYGVFNSEKYLPLALSLIEETTTMIPSLCLRGIELGICIVRRFKGSNDTCHQLIQHFDQINSIVSSVLGRSDAGKECLIRPSYALLEEAILQFPESMFDVCSQLHMSLLSQLSDTLRSDPNEISIYALQEPLLHVLSCMFKRFPDELQSKGIESSLVIFEIMKKPHTEVFKEGLLSLSMIISSLKESTVEILDECMNCVSFGFESQSPEIISASIVMLKILTKYVSITNFGEILDRIFTVIQPEEMVQYIPLSIKAIASMMVSADAKDDRYIEALYKNTLSMANIDYSGESKEEIKFANELFQSFFISSSALLRLSADNHVFLERCRKPFLDVAGRFCSFFPASVAAMKEFIRFLSTAADVFERGRSSVARVGHIRMLIYACCLGDQVLTYLASTLIDRIVSL